MLGSWELLRVQNFQSRKHNYPFLRLIIPHKSNLQVKITPNLKLIYPFAESGPIAISHMLKQLDGSDYYNLELQF